MKNKKIRRPSAASPKNGIAAKIIASIHDSQLFDQKVYARSLGNANATPAELWHHFVKYGLKEGRHFTSSETVAKFLARHYKRLESGRRDILARSARVLEKKDTISKAKLLRLQDARLAVYYNTEGNFYMKEIADLLTWGLKEQGLNVVLLTEKADKATKYDLRIFVAPHEFFLVGEGASWASVVGKPNTVLYNVEQVQTQWFCKAFPFLLKAPLVLDINYQSSEILKSLGCNVVHFMPGFSEQIPFTRPVPDMSNVALVKGYAFAKQTFNWQAKNNWDDRPIDILFIGSKSTRRDAALQRMMALFDDFRFVCVYNDNATPLTPRVHASTNTQITCALAQRSKIVLNIHRDWLGYFEWTRIVLLGLWQGACVVSDTSLLPCPVFDSGEHFLEENIRHLEELIRWLLTTKEGKKKAESVRMAAYAQAKGLGAMHVSIQPVLEAFHHLLAH